MIKRCHPNTILLRPLTMFLGNAIILPDDPFGSDAAQANNDLRPDQSHLIAQILDTGILLRFQGIPVLGRAAFDNVGDVAIGAVDVDDGKHIVQQFACRADKGLSF